MDVFMREVQCANCGTLTRTAHPHLNEYFNINQCCVRMCAA
jgi:hypothetical protein